MKTLYALLIFVLAIMLTGCEKNDDDGKKPIKITLIETESEPPANVSIFFKVDDYYGNPIAHLKQEDFMIYENASIISEYEAERIIRPVKQKFVFHTLLVLDLSGSVTSSENLVPLKNASKSFVENVMPDSTDENFGAYKMAIAWFDGAADIHILIDVTESKAELLSAIEGIESDISNDNSTNLYGAVLQSIDFAEDLQSEYEEEDLISASSLVFFTDGTDRANRESYTTVKSEISESDEYLSFYAIGLGAEIDASKLKVIGKDGSGFASNLDELTEIFNDMAKNVRGEANSYYFLEYCSPSRSGVNNLRITVREQIGKGEDSFDATGFTGGCNLDQE